MAVYNLITSNLYVTLGFAVAERPDDLKVEIVSQTFTISQATVLVEPLLPVGSDVLTFTQTLTKELEISLTSYFNLSDSLARAIDPLFANSLLSLSHAGKKNSIGETSDSLALVQTILVTRSFVGSLVFTQILSLAKVDAIAVSHNPGLSSKVAGYLETDPLRVLIPTPTFPTSPQSVVLTYGTLSLSLRPPNFGDVNSLEHAKINRRTRGGDLKIYRDPQWPRTEKLKYSFDAISESKAKQLLEFIDTTLGRDITLTDYEGFQWTGFISNPEAIITQASRGDDYECDLGFAFEIEFQGVRL